VSCPGLRPAGRPGTVTRLSGPPAAAARAPRQSPWAAPPGGRAGQVGPRPGPVHWMPGLPKIYLLPRQYCREDSISKLSIPSPPIGAVGSESESRPGEAAGARRGPVPGYCTISAARLTFFLLLTSCIGARSDVKSGNALCGLSKSPIRAFDAASQDRVRSGFSMADVSVLAE
jgi:hypothetical protein